MKRRFRFRRRQAVALALCACVLAVAAPTAVAATWEDTHPSDASVAAQAPEQQAPAATRTVITVEEHGSQTLAIVFSASALFMALLAVGIVAVARRPRPRWSAP